MVYPVAGDSTDETYYSNQADWFVEYVEKPSLLLPNSIVVLCNRDPNTGGWNTTDYPLVVGTASDTAEIAMYGELVQVYIDGSITLQADADNRVAAILARLKAEILAGRLIIPHDARVELYDKVDIVDNRTATTRTWPSDETVRISSITHRYNRKEGVYTLELALGEVTSDFGLPEWTALARPSAPSEAVEPVVKKIEEVVKKGPDPTERLPVIPPVTSPTITPKVGPLGPDPYEYNIPQPKVGPPGPDPYEYNITPRKPSLWSTITPWNEQTGETFGSEVMERFKAISKFFGGFFGGKK